MQVTIELKAKKGDQVWVENYRRKGNVMESGVVTMVEAKIDEDLNANVHYSVRLDRKTIKSKKFFPVPIFLTVGAGKIEKISEEESPG